MMFIEARQSQGSFWAGCMIPGSIYWQETEWPGKARGSVPPRETEMVKSDDHSFS